MQVEEKLETRDNKRTAPKTCTAKCPYVQEPRAQDDAKKKITEDPMMGTAGNKNKGEKYGNQEDRNLYAKDHFCRSSRPARPKTFQHDPPACADGSDIANAADFR